MHIQGHGSIQYVQAERVIVDSSWNSEKLGTVLCGLMKKHEISFLGQIYLPVLSQIQYVLHSNG